MAQKTLAANKPLTSLAKIAETSETIYRDKINIIPIIEAILFFILANLSFFLWLNADWNTKTNISYITIYMIILQLLYI